MGKSFEHSTFLAPRGYLHGLTLSTAGSSTTFSVALGEAMDDSFTSVMTTAAISKTTSAWTVGNNNGGMDTGSVAINTWYHVYLIKRPDTGVVDVLFSLSASAPTMPTNYTLKRRIGSLRTNGSSQWQLFSQNNDEFLWSVNDAGGTAFMNSASVTTTAALFTATVPTGVKVTAIYNVQAASTVSNIFFSSPDESDQSAAGVVNMQGGSGVQQGQQLRTRTNTSGQIRCRSSATITIFATTGGWIDDRGRSS